MADFGEGKLKKLSLHLCLFLVIFASGFPIFSSSATDLRLHNNFSCAWLQTVASAFSIAAQQLAIPDDFVAFARSGCMSASKHARLFWAGDQLTSWDPRDGIGSALTAVCSPAQDFRAYDITPSMSVPRMLSHRSYLCSFYPEVCLAVLSRTQTSVAIRTFFILQILLLSTIAPRFCSVMPFYLRFTSVSFFAPTSHQLSGDVFSMVRTGCFYPCVANSPRLISKPELAGDSIRLFPSQRWKND
jgi:hypothetical protein